MLTIKNRAAGTLLRRRLRAQFRRFSPFGFIFLLALLSACTPAGPRALLDGKRLVEQEKYPQAIEKLKVATSLLGGTNALAWDYLGVACQHAGMDKEAELAYGQALALNHDLGEVHFNRGCLWLAQNKLEQAKAEFTVFTSLRPYAPEGFLELGTTQLRSREPGAAEKSFSEALRLRPRNPETLNGLGLARLQQGRAAEAARCFTGALMQQPGYRPALLNLAIVSHQYLKDRQLALQRYREYLALKPAPANADAVAAIVRQLEQELRPPPGQASANAVTQPNLSANPAEPISNRAERTATAPAPVRPSPKGPGRYAYKSPSPPTPGNRSEAEATFALAAKAYQAHRLPEAIQAYRLAVRQDPSLFQAQYNLGLVATEAGDLPLALTSYEYALAIRPTSLDARYNFALVLDQAKYPGDAVNELEKLLAVSPNETRTHLALANLYAQQLRQPAEARQHYLRVLKLEPQHPESAAIRSWLAANPP